jgi:hypothetical protein
MQFLPMTVSSKRLYHMMVRHVNYKWELLEFDGLVSVYYWVNGCFISFEDPLNERYIQQEFNFKTLKFVLKNLMNVLKRLFHICAEGNLGKLPNPRKIKVFFFQPQAIQQNKDQIKQHWNEILKPWLCCIKWKKVFSKHDLRLETFNEMSDSIWQQLVSYSTALSFTTS